MDYVNDAEIEASRFLRWALQRGFQCVQLRQHAPALIGFMSTDIETGRVFAVVCDFLENRILFDEDVSGRGLDSVILPDRWALTVAAPVFVSYLKNLILQSGLHPGDIADRLSGAA